MNLFIRAFTFVKQASSARTLTILGILTLLAAIPLTVYVSQQEQDIRQQASGTCTAICTSEYNACIVPCPVNYSTCDTNYDSCITQCSPDDFSCTNGCSVAKDTCKFNEDNRSQACNTNCTNTRNACLQQCTFNCSGTQNLDGGPDEEYQCQNATIGGANNCQTGWTISSQNPNSCTDQGKFCCWREIGGGAPPPTAVPPTAVPPPSGGATCNSSSSDFKYNECVACNSSRPVCQDSAGAFRTGSNQTDAGCSSWCDGSPPPPTAIPPTVPAGQPAACDPNQLNMSLLPTTPSAGAGVTFSLSGNQGSTHFGDIWSGGVDCSGGFWGSKSCTATANGNFTWTHTWRNCAGSTTNCSTNVCSKSIPFTVGAQAVSPTQTPVPTATGTPAPGDKVFAFTLTLGAIDAGKTIQTPQRQLSVELLDSAGTITTTKTGPVTYQSSSGKFTGSVNMGNIAAGNYQVKVKTGRYLKKRIPGITTIAPSSTTVTMPEATLVVGDMNNDNRVDIGDYNTLVSCFGAKATTPTCGANKTNTDLDDNNAVDEFDFNIFVRSLAVQSGD